MKKSSYNLHDIICNKKCNADSHLKKGFVFSILSFSKEVFNLNNDNIKKYINNLSNVI